MEQKTDHLPATQNVGMQDVADYVGVSRSAVSRVLNNRYIRISDAKRRAILEAADRLAFRPHVAARRLKRNKTDTLRIAFPNQTEPLSEIFLFEMIRHVAAAAKARHYDLLIDLLNTGADALSPLEPGRVDGTILIHDRVLADDQVLRSEESGTPQVLIGGSTMQRRPRYFVDCDIAGGMAIATRHLIDLGHRRVAFLAGAPSQAKLAGFHEALRQAGIEADPANEEECGLEDSAVAAAVDRLLARPNPVTAIAATNDSLALKVLRHLLVRGISSPAEVSVMGFDDIHSAKLSFPSLSTVKIPLDKLAEAAVEALVRQIETRDTSSFQKTFHVELVARESTAPPRRA